MTRPLLQLKPREQDALDEGYRELTRVLKEAGSGICGDDRAERVVDAIATGIIASRDYFQQPVAAKQS